MKIIEKLAVRYPQLYVAPGENNEAAYRAAALQGEPPEEKDLSHFIGSEKDWLKTEKTPAGEVEILHLFERDDFETFVQIILYKGKPEKIMKAVGAQTIIGLRNWEKIQRHREEFLAGGGTEENWFEELKRFDKAGESRDILILVSNGPYSAVPHEAAGMTEAEWNEVSLNIRYYHECAHFICRKTAPDRVFPLWDEITADLTGLRKAMGKYDPKLAAMFLGVDESGYRGGRLEHYLSDEEKENPDETAREIYSVIGTLSEVSTEWEEDRTYELLLHLLYNPLLKR